MIKVRELAYLRFQVPDLEAAQSFLLNFGLLVRERTADRLYMRSYGPEHHVLAMHLGDQQRLLGVGYTVSSEEELELAASAIEGASPVGSVTDPGGGSIVTVRDPDGIRIELVYGLFNGPAIAVDNDDLNTAVSRNRRLNRVVRPMLRPARVMRVGHVVLRSADVARSAAWYRETIGLIESDDVHDDDSNGVVMSFLRLDHRAEFVDHHVLQLLAGKAAHLHHVSFEVQGIDDLHVGHDVLRKAGYEHVWGIGRHLQGSQIFDYWRDPFGVMYEHWTDTDRLNADVPKGRINRSEMHGPWGGEPPQNFREQATP